eukprot:CAMPEP_0172627070 /NCGR_PEP_ID=MMETSP1068-20121228/154206_1 /TAXON_ID=35684 /ORGANISM="Pseudopedinella elastica, Strain CCMP716" /LENGTH=279 /DNA_ID=CAMNT_0013436845 /DNA_START=33 /DNA_END=872 /DNA_ORIENTATION=+
MGAFLRTSPQLTTLCNMEFKGEQVWQCEPRKALVDLRTLDIVGTSYNSPRTNKKASYNETIMSLGDELPLGRQLEFYGKHWDLDRSILFCKFCFKERLGYAEAVIQSFETSPPRAFVDKGIKRLRYAEIVMWRPLCMHRLSHLSKATSAYHLLHEIKILEDAFQRIQANLASGKPFISVGLHELVWSPADLARRMLTFLPWLSSLDPAGNHSALKSQADFGTQHPPVDCCGFDLSTQMCSLDGPEYKLLSPKELMRARDVSSRLVNAARGAVSMNQTPQ